MVHPQNRGSSQNNSQIQNSKEETYNTNLHDSQILQEHGSNTDNKMLCENIIASNFYKLYIN